MGGAADERCGANGDQYETFHWFPRAVVIFGIKDLTGNPKSPLWPVDPHVTLSTLTVDSTHAGAQGR